MGNYGIIKSHAQLKYRRAGMRNNESIHRGLTLYEMGNYESYWSNLNLVQ